MFLKIENSRLYQKMFSLPYPDLSPLQHSNREGCLQHHWDSSTLGSSQVFQTAMFNWDLVSPLLVYEAISRLPAAASTTLILCHHTKVFPSSRSILSLPLCQCYPLTGHCHSLKTLELGTSRLLPSSRKTSLFLEKTHQQCSLKILG